MQSRFSPSSFFVLFLSGLFPFGAFFTQNALAHDIVVVGGGAGGVSAAVQAARMGASVAIVEETDWLGGQMTAAGVSTMDEGVLGENNGIYREFLERVRSSYSARGKTIGTCYWSSGSHCFEPSVGRSVLEQMVAETGRIQVFYRERAVSFSASPTGQGAILGTESGNTFFGKVFIDATEYGDLLPLAGADYRAGNGMNGSGGSCIQDITYTAVIKRYPNGLPAGFLLTPPPGYDETVRDRFSKVIASGGNSTFNGSYPYNFAVHNEYRGMPDSSNPANYDGTMGDQISKTGVNWANDYPAENTYINSVNTTLSPAYLEDRAYRHQVNCAAKLKTLQFIYYVQTDLGHPDWSVANDEGYDTPYNRESNDCENIPASFKALEHNMPVMPYVRESRRGVGLVTVAAADVRRNIADPVRGMRGPIIPTSIAVGDYGLDLHNCNTGDALETNLETPADIGALGAGVFGIPFEALIPASANNLILAEKNISTSRLVNGAVRLQPAVMRTGQAAGIIASEAARLGIQPRNVSSAVVQQLLAASAETISELEFSDAPEGSAHWADLQRVSARGLMVGYGNGVFGVGETLKRRQAAITLSRRYGFVAQPLPACRGVFSDVPVTDGDCPYIEALWDRKITSGCSAAPLMYCPDADTTRWQFGVLFGRAGKVDLGSLPASSSFSDLPTTDAGWPFAESLVKKGLMSACSNGMFCPNAPMLRGDTAASIAASLLADVSQSAAQPTYVGTVLLNRVGVAGVTVSYSGTATVSKMSSTPAILKGSAVSGGSGQFIFNNLPAGRYRLTTKGAGTSSATASVVFTDTSRKEVQIPVRCSSGFVISADAHSCVTPPVLAPRSIYVSYSSTQARATVTWSSARGAKSYRVYRSAGADDAGKPLGSAAVSPFRDSSVSKGSIYFYRVSSIDAAGKESAPTKPVKLAIRG